MARRLTWRLLGGLDAPPLPPTPHGEWGIHPSRKIFEIPTGSEVIPIRYRGFSFFRGIDRIARGEDVRPVIRAFDGYNVARMWPYVPWDVDGWDAPPNGRIVDAVRFMEQQGKQVEVTLLTDDNPKRLPWAISLVEALADARLSNLLLEIGNEPLTHKRINVEALYTACEQSGYLWASGMYEEEGQRENKIRGYYGCAHPARTVDYARRGHDLIEYFTGAGPDVPWVGMRAPWIGDEPKRPDESEAELYWDGKLLTTKVRDYRAHGGVVSLLGAGGTFHYQGGKQALPPNADELACSRAFLAGLLAFPADAPLGGYYGTLKEPNAHPDARTYPVGPWMTRVWQTGPVPEGWTAMDVDGVLCRKA